uniref:Secreted protein n=1 Tax=Steinernema glaseri TaxID=37863 RepID=A0A1I7Y8I0_9BILA
MGNLWTKTRSRSSYARYGRGEKESDAIVPFEAEHHTVVSLELEMLFPALLLLFLLQLGDATFEGKRYNREEDTLHVHLKVDAIFETATHAYFRFRQKNEQTKAIFQDNLASFMFYIPADFDNTSMAVVADFDNTSMAAWDDFEDVERACFSNMTSQADYNKCLTQPNMAIVDQVCLKCTSWTLDKIEVTFAVVRFDEREITGHSLFLPTNTELEGVRRYAIDASKNGERHAAELFSFW